MAQVEGTAHEATYAGQPEFTLTVIEKFQCTKALAHLGNGWKDHFLPEPDPIHVMPHRTGSSWQIDGGLSGIVLRWNPRDVEALHPQLGGASLRLEQLAERGFSNPMIHSLAKQVWLEAQQGNPFGGLFGDAAALNLTVLLIGQLHRKATLEPNVGERLSPAHTRRVLDYMREHLQQDCSLSELAQLCGLSPWHFARCFKNSMGTPPHRYFLRLRMERAQLALRDEPTSIARIASDVGFSDQPSFSRAFSRIYGCSPAQYRRLAREPR
jgi:AraC family transcriptional regulator